MHFSYYFHSCIHQYEVAVDSKPCVCQKTLLVKQICYGILHKILVCNIPPSQFLGTSTQTTHLLTLVSNSGTHSDATLTPSSFKVLLNTTQIIALALISSACGCFCYGTTLPQWAIIDCSMELA